MPESSQVSLDRLIGTLLAQHDSIQRQLVRIEGAIERVVSQHDSIIIRVTALELRHAEMAAGKRVLFAVGGASATIGGLIVAITSALIRIWPWG